MTLMWLRSVLVLILLGTLMVLRHVCIPFSLKIQYKGEHDMIAVLLGRVLPQANHFEQAREAH